MVTRSRPLQPSSTASRTMTGETMEFESSGEMYRETGSTSSQVSVAVSSGSSGSEGGGASSSSDRAP